MPQKQLTVYSGYQKEEPLKNYAVFKIFEIKNALQLVYNVDDELIENKSTQDEKLITAKETPK